MLLLPTNAEATVHQVDADIGDMICQSGQVATQAPVVLEETGSGADVLQHSHGIVTAIVMLLNMIIIGSFWGEL